MESETHHTLELEMLVPNPPDIRRQTEDKLAQTPPKANAINAVKMTRPICNVPFSLRRETLPPFICIAAKAVTTLNNNMKNNQFKANP